MTAIEKALELQQQAITILLTEREQIDAQLARLGHGQEKTPLGKKRGRKPKQQPELSHSESSQSIAS